MLRVFASCSSLSQSPGPMDPNKLFPVMCIYTLSHDFNKPNTLFNFTNKEMARIRNWLAFGMAYYTFQIISEARNNMGPSG